MHTFETDCLRRNLHLALPRSAAIFEKRKSYMHGQIDKLVKYAHRHGVKLTPEAEIPGYGKPLDTKILIYRTLFPRLNSRSVIFKFTINQRFG